MVLRLKTRESRSLPGLQRREGLSKDEVEISSERCCGKAARISGRLFALVRPARALAWRRRPLWLFRMNACEARSTKTTRSSRASRFCPSPDRYANLASAFVSLHRLTRSPFRRKARSRALAVSAKRIGLAASVPVLCWFTLRVNARGCSPLALSSQGPAPGPDIYSIK